MNSLAMRQKVGCAIERAPREERQRLPLKGHFKVEIKRAIDGILPEVPVVDKYEMDNDIVNAGKNQILGVMFFGATQISTGSWVIGLISAAGYSALAAGDTMASHSGWAEFTSYSQANRVAWGPGAASGQAITNGTPAQFSITASGTLEGVFITDQNTIGGTSGDLWATALFSATVPVNNGDVIKITYTISS